MPSYTGLRFDEQCVRGGCWCKTPAKVLIELSEVLPHFCRGVMNSGSIGHVPAMPQAGAPERQVQECVYFTIPEGEEIWVQGLPASELARVYMVTEDLLRARRA